MGPLLLLFIAQILRTVIDDKKIAYGATKTGQDWCIKALHPSEPAVTPVGIPDQSAVPVVLQNYQSTYTIAPSAGCADGWSFELSLLPHPVDFAYYATHDSVVATNTDNFLNQQLGGVTHENKYYNLRTLAQSWRLAYMSATVYQDGPTLSNQGTIVVAQHNFKPQVASVIDTGAAVFSAPRVEGYSTEDEPDFTTAEAMPNAYFEKSLEGAYVPLRLTETCQKWFSDADSVGQTTLTIGAGLSNAFYQIPTTASYPWPHCTGGATSLHSTYVNLGVGRGGQCTSPMLSGVVAQICGRNLSAATRFSVFIRCGIEMQVSPSSALAPQMGLSAPYDPTALAAYFAISRELKDAYPANYNDLGKIWDKISPIAKRIGGLLAKSGVPMVAPIGQRIKMVSSAGDWIRSASQGKPEKKPQKSKKQNKPKQGSKTQKQPGTRSKNRAQERDRSAAEKERLAKGE